MARKGINTPSADYLICIVWSGYGLKVLWVLNRWYIYGSEQNFMLMNKYSILNLLRACMPG